MYPPPVQRLITELGKLPGIGQRTAQRLAFYILRSDDEDATALAAAIREVKERIGLCEVCFNLADEPRCGICRDERRDASLICVVERPVDIITIDKAGRFRGKFHVLGGKISPINGVGPDDLRIDLLEQRLKTEPVREIILALPTDVEGDATSFYLAKRFASQTVKVSRIAYGLPAGSGLEFADDLTVNMALEGRREIT